MTGVCSKGAFSCERVWAVRLLIMRGSWGPIFPKGCLKGGCVLWRVKVKRVRRSVVSVGVG